MSIVTRQSLLPGNPLVLPGDLKVRYGVVMFRRLHRDILKAYPEEQRWRQIFDAAMRLDSIKYPEFQTDMDLRLQTSFFGDWFVFRDQFGPLVTDQIQLIGFVSDRLQRVVLVNGHSRWVNVSSELIEDLGFKFAMYERRSLDQSTPSRGK